MSTPEGSEPQPDNAAGTFHGTEQVNDTAQFHGTDQNDPVTRDQTPPPDQTTEPFPPAPPGQPGLHGQPAQPGQYDQPAQPGQSVPEGQPAYGGPQAGHGQQSGYGAPQAGHGQQPGYGAPQAGHGAPPQSGYPPQPGYGPAGAGHYVYAPGQPVPNPHARPAFVLVSTILAMIGAVVVLFLGIIFAVVGTAFLGLINIEDEFAMAAGALWAIAGVAILWGGLLLTAAILALMRRNWARWVVIVMGGASVALFLVPVVLGDPVLLVGIVWVGISAGFLLAPDVNRWYAMRNAPDSGGALTG